MIKWNPGFDYLQKVIDEFFQDPFLCGKGSPFLPYIHNIKQNPKFTGYQLGKIKIGVFGNQWVNQRKWEKSFWAFLVSKFNELSHHAQPLEIYWFPIPIDKSIQNAPHPFHPIVWNTGSCHHQVGEPCRIFIVRIQEAWKVLCHEAFHWLGLGRNLENPTLTNLWKKERGWISNGPVLLEEAWVETLASIWYPRWLCEYLKKENNEMVLWRLFGEQFGRMSNFCREWWATSSPNEIKCLKSHEPFLDDACRGWYQDTNVYSYVFWKEKLWGNEKIMKFMRLPLEKQIELQKDDRVCLELQIAALRELVEPVRSGREVGDIEIRFLPRTEIWLGRRFDSG